MTQLREDIVIYDETFPPYERGVVHSLLLDISGEIESLAGVSPSERLAIEYSRSGFPQMTHMEAPVSGDHFNLITLCPEDVADWAYQYAHEYLHHILNGRGRRHMPGHLLWFEEMLCCISSLCHIQRLGRSPRFCRHVATDGIRLPLDPSRMPEYTAMQRDLSEGKGVSGSLRLLREQGGNPPYLNIIPALFCQPLFAENPHLWKIVGRLSEMPDEWDIDEVFAHLRRTAEGSYRDSLDKMVAVLFP